MSDMNQEIRSCWYKVVRNSNSGAFEQFFYLLQPQLLRFCLHYGVPLEVAEEIVSDIFVDSWLKRAELLHVENPEIYFMIAVKNRAIRYGEKNAGLYIVGINDECAEFFSHYKVDEALEKKELMMALDRAVESLPQQCKLIFRMVKEEGMKCDDVAEILKISVRTVHAQVYKAMSKLHKALKQDDQNGRNGNKMHIASVILFIVLFFLEARR